MKGYTEYKYSEIQWIGDIPQHWQIKKIKHTTYVKGRIGWQGLKSDEFVDEGPYLVTGTDFINGKVNWNSCYHISDKRYNEAPPIQLKENDLLITKDGSIGKLALVINKPEKAILNSGIFVTRPIKDQYYSKYLFWVLSSPVFRGFIRYFEKGSTIKHLYQETFINFAYPFPPRHEQLLISDFLTKKSGEIDKVIRLKEQQIETLQKYRQSLIKETVTKGLNQDVKMKDSGVEWIGQTPTRWEVRRIKHLTKILRGKFSHRPRNDPKLYDGNHPFIQTGDISNSDKYIRTFSQTLNEKGFKVSKEFPSGTLVMTIAANIGDLAILNFNACFPDSIVGFFPNPKVQIEYLYYNLSAMRTEFFKHATINTQMNLNIEQIGSLYTCLPPLEEQLQIVEYINNQTEQINTVITKIKSQISVLKDYQQSLIYEAVTGKIDVRNYKESDLEVKL
ncbi:restriction endonuclease subunit S [Priestia aryabhattai]|uniref:restriction endonuclease subunit S n=1 Tax=Priestia aryabhattai TaxID=412384 RepID=UPI003D28DC74